ncbi:tryptophan synthase subunit beta [Enterobacteriaceae bacterium G50]|nr:tryptophan synthase subunit beta [Enterobacteriaceae bacterium G50]
MHFIERNSEGQIVRVEPTPFPESTERSDETTTEIGEWLRINTLHQLQQSDLDMVRVLEDLIEVLMSKGVISITDLPPAAQNKLLSRAQARQTLGGLEDLIGEEEDRLI